ncbi:hypothetical protein JHK85_023004 [Glycine max]|nr:hypothetical protein JHK85_023004 [Glycine max]KAG5026613.1 hypothetical protein JHK86_022527 [Glycine max]
MIYTKEMKESLSGQDNRNAFMNLILGKDHGLFYIKNLFIEELAWIDRLHKNAWIGFQSWRPITRKVQKGSRSMLRNCVLAKDCDQPDYVKLAKALCVKHNVSLLTVPCAKTLGEWAGLCKIDSEGKARKVTRCSCNCATMTTSLHQLRLMFFLLHE